MNQIYQSTTRNSPADHLFPFFMLIVSVLLFGAALLSKSMKQQPVGLENRIERLRTTFVIKETEKPFQKPQVVKQEITKKVVPSEPIDLTHKPQLAQKDDVKEEQKSQDAPKVRKVYGLKKVYATGLGSGGSLADAVVGKLGNTLNTDIDTFTATAEEIKGEIVSTSTVTSAPKFRRVVKPVYTKDMLSNKIEGIVRVKVLVDIDGKVKKATALNDLGFESGDQARKATMEMEFEPALRGTEPVAVWIVIPIRFVMLS